METAHVKMSLADLNMITRALGEKIESYEKDHEASKHVTITNYIEKQIFLATTLKVRLEDIMWDMDRRDPWNASLQDTKLDVKPVLTKADFLRLYVAIRSMLDEWQQPGRQHGANAQTTEAMVAGLTETLNKVDGLLG